MRSTPRHTARAVTLVELLASVAVMAVVMGGIGSAMLLASHALPDGNSSRDAVLQGYHSGERIVGELYSARSFSVRTATTVEFTVPDRDADNTPETIRYEWSGTPGDPLTRKYNAQAPMTMVEDVYEYQVDYMIRTLSDTTIQEVVQTSNEELAYFLVWDGVAGNPTESAVTATDWVSQYFTITVPEGATELTITKAQFLLHKDFGGTPADVIVSVHAAMGDGSYTPQATPIGPTATINGADVPATSDWTDADFSGLTITDLGQTEYCLVLKSVSTVMVWYAQLYAKSGPANGTVERWTDDSGASWDPRNNQLNQQDLRFHLYGTYTLGAQEEETTINRDYLTSIGVTVRVGPEPSAQVRTSSQILSAPEVTGQ